MISTCHCLFLPAVISSTLFQSLMLLTAGWPLSRQCEIPWWFTALLPMLSVTHVMPVLEILSVVGVGMQQCIIQNQKEMHKLGKVKNRCKYAANNKQFLATYPWLLVKSLAYHWQLSKSLTFPGFPDKWLTCDLVTGRASACKKFCSNPKLLLFINFSAHMSQLSIDS